ncbi:MAG: DUF58 domain-containing protein [Alkalinema sp. RU_4_3]|nr:DUF58 domain-containing protein [Alkalinema sp. RU_4_3]
MLPTSPTYLLLLGPAAIATALALLTGNVSGAVGLMLLADLVILGLMILDGLLSRPDLPTIARKLPHRLSIGRENPITLTLTGKAPSLVQIRDTPPAEHFRITPATLTTTLEADSTVDLTHSAFPTYRGQYQWGDIYLRQRSRWRLAWIDRKIPAQETVAVYPDLLGLRALTIRMALQSAGALRQKRRIGIGTEFTELRDYSMGDDPRLIDWKATARRSRPLVRVLEPEQEQTLIIMLDRGRLMTAQVEGLARFDWGLNTALALALTALHRGDKVGFAVFDRAIHTWIPPQRGQTHLNQLIDRLTPIQPELIEPDYMGAVSTLTAQQSRRALVVMITDLVDQTASAELLGAMGRLAPRYLPFCVTLRDPLVDRRAKEFASDIEGNYARGVALDMLKDRAQAFEKLRRRGVLVLDAPASQVSDQLVDRYLQLKLRNQL